LSLKFLDEREIKLWISHRKTGKLDNYDAIKKNLVWNLYYDEANRLFVEVDFETGELRKKSANALFSQPTNQLGTSQSGEASLRCPKTNLTSVKNQLNFASGTNLHLSPISTPISTLIFK